MQGALRHLTHCRTRTDVMCVCNNGGCGSVRVAWYVMSRLCMHIYGSTGTEDVFYGRCEYYRCLL